MSTSRLWMWFGGLVVGMLVAPVFGVLYVVLMLVMGRGEESEDIG